MPTKAQATKVGFEYGDVVYCHADSGPLVVKILATGADGFTAEDDQGNRHQVPHDRYLGHQKRSKHAYQIVNEGEDGCLVEDESGQRRFIAGKPPTPEKDKPARDNAHRFSKLHTEDLKLGPMGTLSKALTSLPQFPDGMALLLKAADTSAVRPLKPAKDQPAKVPLDKPKKSVTDKEKKPGPPKHKHGDYVAFRHGDVIGCGRIMGSGQDGVSIEDEETGREHLVRHEAIVDKHPPDPKMLVEADKAPKLSDAESEDKKP